MTLLEISADLSAALRPLTFAPPVTHVYNPLDHARSTWSQYVERFGAGPKEVVLLGMNPGPWGMVQTGVPFGEVALVRDWMGIEGAVESPVREHPKRPVEGFDCRRSEVSGRRLWGWARDRFGTPERFFERFFVANYCPMAFMEESGKNRTPDKLPVEEREVLFAECDLQLRRTIEHLTPRWVIGIGAFAEGRARRCLQGMDLEIGRILHPSPASPAANRGWAEQAERQLREQGIELPGC
ncbi:MAG: uracil-DNA glycosylase family protein [Acidobacteriota bacterium]